MAKKKKSSFTSFTKKVNKQVNKYKKQINVTIIVFLVVLSMFFSAYYRSYSATLPVAENWATDSVLSGVRNQVNAQVNQEFPNLPDDRKSQIINERVDAIVQGQREVFDEQVEQNAQFIRERLQNEEGQTYLLAIDPYQYLRYTSNYVENGHSGEMRNGEDVIDAKMTAPHGVVLAEDQFHTIFSAFIFKIVNFFSKSTSLFSVFFWVPVIVSSLAVIPAFFIANKVSGKLGAFIASVLVAIHPAFLGRTAAGFSDTDAYNVTFPLFIFWLFLEAFYAKNLYKKITYSALSALLVGMYAKAWVGWWYIFDFALIVLIGHTAWLFIRHLIKHKKINNKDLDGIKHSLSIAGMFIVLSGVFVTLFSSFTTFINAPLAPLGITTLQNAAYGNLWPNVFTTVAELNQSNIPSIVNQLGGKLSFFVACLGILLVLLPKKMKANDWFVLLGGFIVFFFLITDNLLSSNRILYLFLLCLPFAAAMIYYWFTKEEVDIKASLFLLIWFVGTIYASTQGVRFTLLIVPVYALAFGSAIGQIYQRCAQTMKEKFTSFDYRYVAVPLAILLLLTLRSPLASAHRHALGEVPSMNDTWWETLSKIKAESNPNTIITSWWDFGHWFKWIADRRVTFDGASQTGTPAHWVGNALSASDEEFSVGIFRMLACGNSKGFEEFTLAIQKETNPGLIRPETTLKAKPIFDEALLIRDHDEAVDFYMTKAKITEDEAKIVADLTHCNPPENYIITSEDMVGKAGVWGHFGNWDFAKAYVYNEARLLDAQSAVTKITEQTDLDEETARKLYFEAIALANEDAANAWISPWPNYLTPRPIGCSQQEENIISCGVGATLSHSQGQIIALDAVRINLINPEESKFIIGVYSSTSRQKLGEDAINPRSIIFASDELQAIEFEDVGLEYNVFFYSENGQYRAIIAAKELADSLFTRLFYINGEYTNYFDKFSDLTSPLTGQRIIVYSIDWDKVLNEE